MVSKQKEKKNSIRNIKTDTCVKRLELMDRYQVIFLNANTRCFASSEVFECEDIIASVFQILQRMHTE